MNNKSLQHIAIFMPSMVGGGAERVMLTLIQEFCKRGIRVDLILVQLKGVFLSQLPEAVKVYDCKATRVLFAIPALVRYLKEERPEVLLSAMEHANAGAELAKIISRVSVRLVVSTHTNLAKVVENSKTFRERFIKYWALPFYHYADKVIVVSNGAAINLAKMLKLPADKVAVIYNPVLTEELKRLSEMKLSHPWFTDRQFPVIVAVGRLNQAKDYPTLIRAFAKVCSQMRARLLILGEGEERKDIEKLINDLNLNDDIAIPGFEENPYSYMKAADLFVISSRWEGFGNVLAEALACGTPVISTNYESGASEILEDGKWGKLVPVGDVSALADAMLTSLANGKQPFSAAVESAYSRFSAEKIIEQYIDLLFLRKK